MPTRTEAIGAVIALALSPARRLMAQVIAPASTIASQIKSLTERPGERKPPRDAGGLSGRRITKIGSLPLPSNRLDSWQRWRLILAAGLFIAWIGWLTYLAATATRPVILSRPQFLVSELDVIAQVHQGPHGPDREVTVDEVHWTAQENEKLKGKKITVLNLDSIEAHDGWEGPGQYILPLRKTGTDAFVVVPPPMSPGFEPMKPRPRIYRATPETLRQLDAISKSK